jgi:hypothetical protein
MNGKRIVNFEGDASGNRFLLKGQNTQGNIYVHLGSGMAQEQHPVLSGKLFRLGNTRFNAFFLSRLEKTADFAD